MDPFPGNQHQDMPSVYKAEGGDIVATTTNPRPKPSSTGIIDRFTQIVFFFSLLAVTLYDSRIISLFKVEGLEVSINRSLYLVALLGILIGLLRLQIPALVFSFVIMAYFLFLVFQFMAVSNVEYGSSEFGFSPFYARLQLFCVPMISALIVRGRQRELKTSIYLTAFIYLAIYILASIIIAPSVDTTFRASAFVADYDGRGGRVFLNNALVSLAFFVSLSDLLKRGRLVPITIFILCCISVYLSQSRYYQFCLILTTVCFMVIRNLRIIGILFTIAFSLGSLFFTSRIISGENPFTFIAGDRSLETRALSFDFVRSILQEHFISGVGLANTPVSDALLVKLSTFFWTDLGLVGIFYVGGIIGLSVFIIMSLTCFFCPWLLRRALLLTELYGGICLAAMCTAIYGIIAPTLWYNGLEVFIFVLGATFARRQANISRGQAAMAGSPAATREGN
jgi:hypothetical protein